jgi:putative hydrolase of the HAD superfamily
VKGDGAVLWDFDRTLVRGWYLSECLMSILDELEPEHGLTREDLSRHLQHGFPWHTPMVPHPHLDDPDAWWANVRPIIIGALISAGVDHNLAQDIAVEVRSRMFEPDGFVVYEDTLPALERLRSSGWRQAVVSNHYPELPKVVERLGLAPYFDHVFTSAAVGYEKPHPEIFLAALRALGNPSQVWMVGDNREHDIEGAAAVGIPGILIDREGADEGEAARALVVVVDLILSDSDGITRWPSPLFDGTGAA